ncbi:MAG: hemolysin III family protein [Bacteroidaceae bacterium]|nr:hemolysin III family protein [Bacteroidales bacterium]MBQ2979911.1 hemolysin III family protein [Bacteroidaceae bacterium]
MNSNTKYTPGEEKANSISHIAGGIISLIAGIYFLVQGYNYGSALTVMSLWLYLGGVLFSYITSVIYHLWPTSRTHSKALIRQLDHTAIYWHIAGCYSPVALIAMVGSGATTWGWVIFAFVWLCTIAGTALSFRKMQSHSYIETACYVLMGLTILVAFKPFYESVGMGVVSWVIAEGICYITGAVLYSIHKVRYMHTFFHIMVIAGDICHMIAVGKILQMFVGI